MLKESTRDKSTEEEKKEVTRRMDVREQPEKKEPIRSCHREGNTARGSKGERGAGRRLLKRGMVGGTVSSVGVSGPTQLCNSAQLRQLREQNPVFPLQFSRCHVQSGSQVG